MTAPLLRRTSMTYPLKKLLRHWVVERTVKRVCNLSARSCSNRRSLIFLFLQALTPLSPSPDAILRSLTANHEPDEHSSVQQTTVRRWSIRPSPEWVTTTLSRRLTQAEYLCLSAINLVRRKVFCQMTGAWWWQWTTVKTCWRWRLTGSNSRAVSCSTILLTWESLCGTACKFCCLPLRVRRSHSISVQHQ